MADKVNPEQWWRAKACVDRSSHDEYHDELKDDLLKAATLVEKMRKLLDSANAIMANSNIECGVCCCGDNMKGHGNPMDCGHSPVDMASHSVYLWQKAYEEL